MGNCMNNTQDERKKKKELSTSQLVPVKLPVRSNKTWQQLLKTDALIIQAQFYITKSLQHPSNYQIAKDINRTYPNQPFFKENINLNRFQKLLQRISIYLVEVGYTQGMNFISGQFLLNGMSDEDAYKSMIQLLLHPKLMLVGLFQNVFPLNRLYCALFWRWMLKNLPVLSNKIKQICIDDEMWLFKWFITMFITILPAEYIKEIFTFILQFPEMSLVKLAIAVILVGKKQFEDSNQTFFDDFVGFNDGISKLDYCTDKLPLNKIIQCAFGITTEQILIQLSQVSCNNWYKTYFGSPVQKQRESHSQFLKCKQKERKEFLKSYNNKESSSKYCRGKESVQIIDLIQQKKSKFYRSRLSMSLEERSINHSYQLKKKFSLHQIPPQNNYTNVVSYIHD